MVRLRGPPHVGSQNCQPGSRVGPARSHRRDQNPMTPCPPLLAVMPSALAAASNANACT
jgi:hypothetical protein